MSHVALNALFLHPGATGGAEFVYRNLAPALLRRDPVLRMTVFACSDAAESARVSHSARLQVVGVPVPASSRLRRSVLEQSLLPLMVARSGADLLHNLATTAPAWSPVPQVTTILDLNFRHARAHSPLLGKGIATLASMAARRSARVITISQFVADDLGDALAVPPEKIDVAWLGPGIVPALRGDHESVIRERFALSEAPIILCPASARPHKNVPRLIDAFGRLGIPAQLVLTGVSTGFEDEVSAAILACGRPNDVHAVGWVDDETLAALYDAAEVMAFPSLAEGFGLPLVEAMGRGAAVVCSNRTSLPEVGGDAAAYFDPESVTDMAAQLQRVLADPAYRSSLVESGRIRSRLFTWDHTADVVLSSYRRTLGLA